MKHLREVSFGFSRSRARVRRVMPKAANPATQGVVSAALADTDAIAAPLVSYLKRLRDLDETASALTGSIKRAVDAKLEETRDGRDDGKRARGGGERGETAERRTDPRADSNPSTSDASSVKRDVEDWTRRCVAVCDEKVALAQQCYDLVEQHIARLDKDLRVFDQALAEKEAAAAAAKGLVPPPTAASVGGAGLASPEPPAVAGAPAGARAAAANPDEPKYCVCNRVSFGEMIACENEECPVEWFHFACVGLSTDAKIKGKWYCNACSAERRKLKKLEAKAAGDKAK